MYSAWIFFQHMWQDIFFNVQCSIWTHKNVYLNQLSKGFQWVLSIYESKSLWVNESLMSHESMSQRVYVQLPKPIKWKLKFQNATYWNEGLGLPYLVLTMSLLNKLLLYWLWVSLAHDSMTHLTHKTSVLASNIMTMINYSVLHYYVDISVLQLDIMQATIFLYFCFCQITGGWLTNSQQFWKVG